MSKTAKRCRIVIGKKETCCINPNADFSVGLKNEEANTI